MPEGLHPPTRASWSWNSSGGNTALTVFPILSPFTGLSLELCTLFFVHRPIAPQTKYEEQSTKYIVVLAPNADGTTSLEGRGSGFESRWSPPKYGDHSSMAERARFINPRRRPLDCGYLSPLCDQVSLGPMEQTSSAITERRRVAALRK